MKKLSSFILILSLGIGAGSLQAMESAISSSPEGASVYIITPKNGETITGPVTVKFGLRGMGVAPAGVVKENTGHHHLLINAENLPVAGRPMGGDVKHFGGGQTETVLDLPKGEHTLQLLLGNHLHIPHDPLVASEKITIIVE